MRLKPNLLIVGHGRHGKDTVCECLRDRYGFTFESSSRFCSKLFLFEALRYKYGYATEEECYADRHNRRKEWFDTIALFNQHDAARLGKAMFDEFDIYCGLRNKREFFEMQNQNVFDVSIWVDRSKLLPLESPDSMTIERGWTDYEIDNNGPLAQLHVNIKKVMDQIL